MLLRLISQRWQPKNVNMFCFLMQWVFHIALLYDSVQFYYYEYALWKV